MENPPAHKQASRYERLGSSPFYVYSAETPPPEAHSKNNTYRLMNWHAEAIGAAKAHAISTGNSNTIIGIIDSGTELNHAAFRENLWINSAEDLNRNGMLDSLDLNGIDDDGNGVVDDVIGYDFVDTQNPSTAADFREVDPFPADEFVPTGHGALVHSLIRELAPSVQIMTLRAADANGLLEEDDIARSIIYAVENGAAIINMSFGNSTYSPFLEDVVNYAAARGVTMIAATGNGGASDIIFPARFKNVIAVGNATEFNERASSSNFGEGIDLLAPGSSIASRGIGGKEFSVTGTSFATPMVSATAALIMDIYPQMNAEEIRHHLKITATDLGAAGYDEFTGAGLLNMHAAVQDFSTNTIEIASPAHQAAFRGGMLPLVLNVNGTHIRELELRIMRGNETIRTEQLSSQFFAHDTIFELNLAELAEGEYRAELRSNLFNGTTLESSSTFFVDRTAPRFSLFRSGEILRLNDVAFYLEAEFTEAARLSAERLTGELLFRSDQFQSSLFRVLELNADSLQITLADRAGNVADTTIAALPREVWSASQHFQSETILPIRGLVADVKTDVNSNGFPEFWISKFAAENSQVLDTLYVVEQVGNAFSVVAKRPMPFALRDARSVDSDMQTELLFSYAGVSEVWQVSTDFTFSKEAGSTLGLASQFLQNSAGEYDVLLRTTDDFLVLDKSLSVTKETLESTAPQATVLGIPRSVVLQKNDTTWLFYSDANGNINRFRRVGASPFQNAGFTQNRYGGGVHNLSAINGEIFSLGSALSDAAERDNSYGTRRRFFMRFTPDLQAIDSLMIADRFGAESSSFTARRGNFYWLNVSGDLVVFDSLFTPVANFSGAENYSSVETETGVLISQHGEIRHVALNAQAQISINSVRLSQPKEDSVFLAIESAASADVAYIYEIIGAASPVLIDSTASYASGIWLPLASQMDSIRYMVQLRQGSLFSGLISSNALRYRKPPRLVSAAHENGFSRFEFDYPMNGENAAAAFSVGAGQISSIIQPTPQSFVVFAEIAGETALSIRGLRDSDGRAFADSSFSISRDEIVAGQGISGYELTSPSKVKIAFRQPLAAAASVREITRERSVQFTQSGNEITIQNAARFAYDHHYQYEIDVAGEVFYVGFTNSEKINKTIFFPNPYLPDEHDHVSFTNVPEFSWISIYSFSGKRIFRKQFIQGAAHFRLNFQDEIGYIPASGMYFYIIQTEDRQHKGKFTIVR